jgi:uncharacterized membrane protein
MDDVGVREPNADREPPLSKARFEAFSDGIFAVAATLLVLDLKTLDLKDTSVHAVLVAFGGLWRPLLSFASSFLVVGVVWINHHTLFRAVRSVNRMTVVLNLLLLMLVALIPFPTALLAAYHELWPIDVLYGVLFAIIGIAFNGLWLYVRMHYRIREHDDPDARLARRSDLRGLVWPIGYALGAALAPVNTTVSLIVYAIIPVYFLFPSPVEAALYRRAR